MTATVALNADTTADAADIAIDSVGDLPIGLVTASTGDVTLNSTGDINETAMVDAAADVVGSTINLTALVGGIGTLQVLDVTATVALNADSTADAADIAIDSVGELPIGLVTASTGVVTLNSSGDINETAVVDAAADVVGSTINLTAMAGDIGNQQVLDVTATTALNADAGNIAIDSVGDLPIGLVTAVAGVVTLNSSGDINETAVSDAAADVVGSTINLTALVGGIGTLQVLDVTATTALNADTTADASDIAIDSVGDLPIGLVTTGTGVGTRNLVLNSTGAMTNANGAATNLIAGSTTLTATGGIGTAGSVVDTSIDDLQATNATSGGIFVHELSELSIIGTGVTTTGGGGDISVVVDALDFHVDAIVVSDAGDVTLNAQAGNLALNADVTAGSTAATAMAGQLLSINANVAAVNTVNIAFDTTSAAPSITNFNFIAGNLSTATGSVNASLFQTVMIGGVVRYAALDMSGPNIGNPDITNGATAVVDVVAPGGAEFDLQIDWREANGVVSLVGPFPGGVVPVPVNITPPNANAAVANLSQITETTFGVLDTVGTFNHTFFANPEGANAEFIDIVAWIPRFVGGSVVIEAGTAMTPLQQLSQAPGSLGANLGPGTVTNFGDQQMGIMAVIRLDVQPFLVGEAIPLLEELPVEVPISTTLPAPNAPTPPVTFVSVQVPLPSTPGAATQAEVRFYELRIVSITQEGELEELTEERISLDDPRYLALNPNGEKFNPSKLPQLFKRLPADRYRIYLVEDGAERLVLEFVIEQSGGEGRPVELPEQFESSQKSVDPGTPRASTELPKTVPTAMDSSDPTIARPSLGEQLSRSSFVSSGGIIFGASLLSRKARMNRADKADKRMAAFARCPRGTRS